MCIRDRNYSRSTGTQLGQTIPGNRASDPNYDGVNFYGDETTLNLSRDLLSPIKNGIISQLNPFFGAGSADQLKGIQNASFLPAFNTIANYSQFLNSNPLTRGLVPFAALLYGDIRGNFTDLNVSRTGYAEKDVVDPTALNVKFQGSIHYKINDNVEASFSAYNGSGNTVYTGSDRYSIKDFSMGQYKLELKARNWYVRAYTTLENSGASFNSTIAARYFNEAWKPSTTWYPTYAATYSTLLSPVSYTHLTLPTIYSV